MAWRFVKQPNGRYARFSEIVDNFTHSEMTRQEAAELCSSPEIADTKLRAADEHPERYQEALSIIESVHGNRERALAEFDSI